MTQLNFQGNFRELNKKILFVVIAVLILFAGFIAVTQETDIYTLVPANADVTEEDIMISTENPSDSGNTREMPDWVRSARWFRSNSGGMAVEEMPSQAAAIRNEYALAVAYTGKEELPPNLLPFYNDDLFIESRILYENGLQKRIQWILRDWNGASRVVGVFIQPELSDNKNSAHNGGIKNGFIEIYNERSFLITEYRFLEDGTRSRINYAFNDNFLVSSTVYLWEENDRGGEYVESYADYLRYNRSLFLRGVERVFFKGRKISLSDEPLRVSFTRDLADTDSLKKLISEKFHSYPEFFGEVFVHASEKIVYTTDERSRILSQTLYDSDNKIVWVINNKWVNGRIASTEKKEGGAVSLAEFSYDSEGEKILEKNYKNGILERVVRREGKTDIEELYMNNMIVLRAVWEDGRKISETRVSSSRTGRR